MWHWLFGSKNSSVEQVAKLTNGDGRFQCEVVGESHYQMAIKSVAGGYTEEGHRLRTTAILSFEDDNPHDSNAVCVRIEGKRVGYLARKTASSFRRGLQAAAPGFVEFECDALIVGGWDRGDGDRGYFGVRLDLPMGND